MQAPDLRKPERAAHAETPQVNVGNSSKLARTQLYSQKQNHKTLHLHRAGAGGRGEAKGEQRESGGATSTREEGNGPDGHDTQKNRQREYSENTLKLKMGRCIISAAGPCDPLSLIGVFLCTTMVLPLQVLLAQ